MSHPIIQVNKLRKEFHVGEVTVRALRGVDFEVNRGEFVAIMGTSGSGKSTMLNILGCLDKPSAGEYLLDGQATSQLTKNELAALRNRKLGFVFQSYNLFPHMSVLKNITLGPQKVLRISRGEAEAQAEQLLDRFGLSSKINEYPDRLSGGQQQRVAVVR